MTTKVKETLLCWHKNYSILPAASSVQSSKAQSSSEMDVDQ